MIDMQDNLQHMIKILQRENQEMDKVPAYDLKSFDEEMSNALNNDGAPELFKLIRMRKSLAKMLLESATTLSSDILNGNNDNINEKFKALSRAFNRYLSGAQQIKRKI